MQNVLINGQWISSDSASSFHATNPTTGQSIEKEFPVSNWQDCDAALEAAQSAFIELRKLPSSSVADFLEEFADRIDAASESLVELAHAESGLPKKPRLADVELPRTSGQLRKAATAARDGSWALPTIDTAANIRSCYEPIGPVCIFGPNNFPFAFNSVAGGDFAAAIAAGNPVIGKANSSHPATTQRLAELAHESAIATGMPTGFVQLIYRTSHADGERLVSDPRLAAVGYTGSRGAGLKLKAAADAVGKPIYLELSSVNPVVILPNALSEDLAGLVDQYVTSGLMGAGQFCTNPGLLMLLDGESTDAFVSAVVEKYSAAAAGTLLSPSVATSLGESVQKLAAHGAEILCGAKPTEEDRCSFSNTVLKITGQQFLKDPEGMQTEAFGNAVLIVTCRDIDELHQSVCQLEGNLTGCIYSDSAGKDDDDYNQIAPDLAQRVGRMLNDKMPTGVAVSSAMNHGGPYPATGHPGFTAVGVPASLIRFAKLTSYDNVRASRLPSLLKDKNPTGSTFRLVDTAWVTTNL
jgi:NADP-dependent aldehyde dehydrogenase